jgi:hypothetical protein
MLFLRKLAKMDGNNPATAGLAGNSTVYARLPVLVAFLKLE